MKKAGGTAEDEDEKIEEEVVKKREERKAGGSAGNDMKFSACYSTICYSSTVLLSYLIWIINHFYRKTCDIS